MLAATLLPSLYHHHFWFLPFSTHQEEEKEEERPIMEPGFSNAIPNWLDMLMKINFFDPCLDHQLKLKGKNWFCVDCCISFCLLRSNHSDHRALRIRKYNSHEVVKAEEMENIDQLLSCTAL